MSTGEDFEMNQGSNEQPNNRDSRSGLLLGLCIGAALGVSLGVALDSIPIGVAIGAGVGVSLGIAFSGQRQEPSRPLTIAGVALLLVGGHRLRRGHAPGPAPVVVRLSYPGSSAWLLMGCQWWCGE